LEKWTSHVREASRGFPWGSRKGDFMKEITENTYLNLSKNGARILFDWYNFRFIDCYNHDLRQELNHIIINFKDEKTSFFQVDMKSMYDFLTIYHHCSPSYLDEAIGDKLEELIMKGKKKK
jgi:hypothetical protein